MSNDLLCEIEKDIKQLDVNKIVNFNEQKATMAALNKLKNDEDERDALGLPALLSNGEIIMGHKWDGTHRKWVNIEKMGFFQKLFGKKKPKRKSPGTYFTNKYREIEITKVNKFYAIFGRKELYYRDIKKNLTPVSQQLVLRSHLSENHYSSLALKYEAWFYSYGEYCSKEDTLLSCWKGQHDINETMEQYIQRVKIMVLKYYTKYQKQLHKYNNDIAQMNSNATAFSGALKEEITQ